MLLVRRLVVDEDDNSPVPREDVAGDVPDPAERPAGHVRAVHAALVEVPRKQAVAFPAVRILAHPARTQDVAGADLQEASLELVGHGSDLLPRGWLRSSRFGNSNP